MKTLYFDCSSGISGDMCLSALLDLGVEEEYLVGELQKLRLDGWTLPRSQVSNHAPHVHRNMADIRRIIDESEITTGAKDLAKRIFIRLAVAEAKVHRTTPEEVHFHEVGAVDSIIDIVGVAVCIDFLAPEHIYASALRDGYGFVDCQHGRLPIPVPAVREILAVRGVRLQQIDVEGELITPTGAAIIAELAERFGPMPEMNALRTAYGAGTKDFGIPNRLRIVGGVTV